MSRASLEVERTIKLEVVDCCVCGVWHGIPASMHHEAKQNGATWYCPNGHRLSYRETEADRLKCEVAKERAAKQQAERRARNNEAWAVEERNARLATERRLSATKGVVTRIKNRVAKGVCPCCRRHFSNLQRHMEHRHPDWQPEADADEG